MKTLKIVKIEIFRHKNKTFSISNHNTQTQLSIHMLFVTMLRKTEIDPDRPSLDGPAVHVFHRILGRMHVFKSDEPEALVPAFLVVPNKHSLRDSTVPLKLAFKFTVGGVPVESENSDAIAGSFVFLVGSVVVSPWIVGLGTGWFFS